MEGVLIASQTSRRLDAIFVYEESPTIAHGGTNYSLVDYSDYDIDIKGPGVFELVFLIYSDNFPAIKESFILKIGTKKEGLIFYRA
ncbi:MAG: hypothetical protein WAM14_04445 [Candidatus Nitrosopolaris sp.]